MFKRKKNAFTLIELIAVLVIMAIIALIVTPLVMSIIRKARVSADKRSVDAYGRSVELAIAGYLMDTGSLPTSIEQLTIEYSGDEVVCSTTQLNSDSSVYLAGCTVGGRSVEGYTYGKEETTPTPSYTAYNVGDHVSYNGVTYYVIEDSDTTNDTVKLLKENPLTKTEMDNLNLVDVTVSQDYRGSEYGRVKYGLSVEYSLSNVKKILDAWKVVATNSSDKLIVRLIMFDELIDDLGFEIQQVNTSFEYNASENTPNWVNNGNNEWWTMTLNNDETIWSVGFGKINSHEISNVSDMVRPVLELNKSADITKID